METKQELFIEKKGKRPFPFDNLDKDKIVEIIQDAKSYRQQLFFKVSVLQKQDEKLIAVGELSYMQLLMSIKENNIVDFVELKKQIKMI